MAHYIARFTTRNGCFVREADIIADGDDMALLAVGSMLGAHDIELWDHERLVGQFARLANEEVKVV